MSTRYSIAAVVAGFMSGVALTLAVLAKVYDHDTTSLLLVVSFVACLFLATGAVQAAHERH